MKCQDVLIAKCSCSQLPICKVLLRKCLQSCAPFCSVVTRSAPILSPFVFKIILEQESDLSDAKWKWAYLVSNVWFRHYVIVYFFQFCKYFRVNKRISFTEFISVRQEFYCWWWKLYMCSKYPVKFCICSLSIKTFHPYFELFYFRHGKAVWSSKLSKRHIVNKFDIWENSSSKIDTKWLRQKYFLEPGLWRNRRIRVQQRNRAEHHF